MNGLILHLIWTLQQSLLNVRIWTFNWVWHENYNGLFNVGNLVSSLILMLVRICLCNTILYTWFGKKWKQLKFWGWIICLVYAYFFKHLSLSMLISFLLTKKSVLINWTPKIGLKYYWELDAWNWIYHKKQWIFSWE